MWIVFSSWNYTDSEPEIETSSRLYAWLWLQWLRLRGARDSYMNHYQ